MNVAQQAIAAGFTAVSTLAGPIPLEQWTLRDPEPWELAWNESAAQVAKDNEAWVARWPAHCKTCGGWGLFQFEERHGFSHGPGEIITDPCGAIEDLRVCHRCGCLGLNAEGEGPCTACGWNCDDGLRTM